jgi:hypothetical protein
MLDKEILVENVQVFFPVSLRDDEEMFLVTSERETSCPSTRTGFEKHVNERNRKVSTTIREEQNLWTFLPRVLERFFMGKDVIISLIGGGYSSGPA